MKRQKVTMKAPMNVELNVEDIEMSKICSDTEEESEAECPKCGIIYGETTEKWICCDGCNTWLDLKCAKIFA